MWPSLNPGIPQTHHVNVITPPVLEPVTLAEIQLQCRIDTVADGDEILIAEAYIPAARDYVEWRTGATFHQKTLELVLDRIPCWNELELPGATPLIEIESFKYRDSDGVVTTWPSGSYVTASGGERRLGRIAPAYGQTWPSFIPYPLEPIKIRYTAGIAQTFPFTEVSAKVKHPISLLVAKMWEYREAVIVADRQSIAQISVEYGIEAFISVLQAEYAF